jgi:hypothetical protein
LSKTGRAESSAPAAKHTTADKVITPHIAAITNRFAFIIFVSFPSLFAERPRSAARHKRIIHAAGR